MYVHHTGITHTSKYHIFHVSVHYSLTVVVPLSEAAESASVLLFLVWLITGTIWESRYCASSALHV